MENIQQPFSFRLYIRRDKSTGSTLAIFLYWDTRLKDKGLVDPWLYDHAAHSDIESRIWLARLVSADCSLFYYAYELLREQEIDDIARNAIQELNDHRRAELQHFFEHCWNLVYKNQMKHQELLSSAIRNK
jgi:hypothetical protein